MIKIQTSILFYFLVYSILIYSLFYSILLSVHSLEAVLHVHVLATGGRALPHLQAVEHLPNVVAARLRQQLGRVQLQRQVLARRNFHL